MEKEEEKIITPFLQKIADKNLKIQNRHANERRLTPNLISNFSVEIGNDTYFFEEYTSTSGVEYKMTTGAFTFVEKYNEELRKAYYSVFNLSEKGQLDKNFENGRKEALCKIQKFIKAK